MNGLKLAITSVAVVHELLTFRFQPKPHRFLTNRHKAAAGLHKKTNKLQNDTSAQQPEYNQLATSRVKYPIAKRLSLTGAD